MFCDGAHAPSGMPRARQVVEHTRLWGDVGEVEFTNRPSQQGMGQLSGSVGLHGNHWRSFNEAIVLLPDPFVELIPHQVETPQTPVNQWSERLT